MSKRAAKPKPQDDDILKAPELLKAVILADNFNKAFRPVSYELPRALFPLVNLPILDYTIEFLAASGVQEIYVFCVAHAAQIQKHLSTRSWPGVTVKPLQGSASTVLSVGDALRDVHDLGVISSDFILVSGDVVSNLDLAPIFREHKDRVSRDKSALMTMVFKKASAESRARYMDEEVTLVLDPDSKELLDYKILTPMSSSGEQSHDSKESKELKLDTSLFEHHPTMQIRSDLIDCNILICSPEFLGLFKDNFDFQDIRRDFIHSVMNDEILLQNKIFCHVISNAYAARVESFRAYDSVARDVIKRWTYPMVPDHSFLTRQVYKFRRPNNYVVENVTLAMTCDIGTDTVIGSASSVGQHTQITQSTIGKNVTIGANVKISNSYIWDDVVIEDGATLSHAFVCSGAKIGAGAVLPRGSVISFGVAIAPGFHVPELARITCVPLGVEEIDEEDGENVEDSVFKKPFMTSKGSEASEVGSGGTGRKWTTSLKECELKAHSMGFDLCDIQNAEEEGEGSEGEEEESEGEDEIMRFLRECHDTVRRAITDSHRLEDALLEINALRLSYDATFEEAAHGVLGGILSLCDDGSGKAQVFLANLKKHLRKWGTLVSRYVKTEQDQVQLIFSIMDLARSCGGPYVSAFDLLLNTLYDIDKLSEEALVKWWKQIGGGKGTKSKSDVKDHANLDDLWFANKSEKFMTWLMTAEEEDSDED